MKTYNPLSDFLTEYRQLNVDNLYRPVAVGKYGIRSREEIYSKDLAKDFSKNKLIFKNTLTIGMGSSQIDIGILDKDEIHSVSPAYHTYKINSIDSSYLSYCLECRNMDMFNRFVKRGSRQGKTIDFKNWLSYKIPTYDYNSQIEIVSILNKAKCLIKKCDEYFISLDKLTKSQFVEMFGDCNLFQKSSSWVALKNLGEIIGGATPRTNNLTYWDGNLPWITPDEIEDDSFVIVNSRRTITEDGRQSASLQVMPKGTVILSSRAPIGKTAIAGKDMYCNQGFKNIFCGHDLNPIYLYFLLKCNVPYLQSLGRGATFKEISKTIVENILIPCPSRNNQDSFSSFYKQVDKSKFRVKQLQEKAETLYKALLQKYFG